MAPWRWAMEPQAVGVGLREVATLRSPPGLSHPGRCRGHRPAAPAGVLPQHQSDHTRREVEPHRVDLLDPIGDPVNRWRVPLAGVFLVTPEEGGVYRRRRRTGVYNKPFWASGNSRASHLIVQAGGHE